MTKLIISIVVSVIVIAITFGGMRFTSSPFSFSIPQWRTALAVILFLVGGELIYLDGIKDGMKSYLKYEIEQLKAKTNELNEENQK